jgi:hypothetical protein
MPSIRGYFPSYEALSGIWRARRAEFNTVSASQTYGRSVPALVLGGPTSTSNRDARRPEASHSPLWSGLCSEDASRDLRASDRHAHREKGDLEPREVHVGPRGSHCSVKSPTTIRDFANLHSLGPCGDSARSSLGSLVSKSAHAPFATVLTSEALGHRLWTRTFLER